ncbi:hypothetical protein [Nocardia sp. NPDC057668]|uniref:hypothetical protein n=1 Tax=Nocardia sp. NPDC057668 TaxID=3346202 RepID=UPI00366A93F0
MYDLPPTDHWAVPVMTVDNAHRVMQQHLTCPATLCPRKRQAKHRLTEAAHLVPADQPHFGG